MKINKKKVLVFIGLVLLVCTAISMVSFATSTAAPEVASPTPAAQPAGQSRSWLLLIVYIVFIVAIGYFLLFRPNKKRKKEEEKLKSSLMLGDTIVTIGGIVGTIVNIKDDNITIETSIDRTVMEFKNWAIREVQKKESE